MDAEDAIALSLCVLGRGREALPSFKREQLQGYFNERNLAWFAAVERAQGHAAAARAVEDRALRLSGGDPAVWLHHPLLEHLLPVPD
jgi:hypothetical protein